MFKKRIGLTQRVMKHPRYDEVMDCLDTNWATLLTSLDILPVPLPLMSPDYVPAQWDALQLDGLILSGGNTLLDYADDADAPESLSPARDAYEMALLEVAISSSTPVLGICRGLQLINVYYGGRLMKVKGHAGTRHTLVTDTADDVLVCPTDVNSFHDCAVPREGLGSGLIPLAHDETDHIEACRHTHDRVLAIMWHPEREDPPLENDCQLLKKYFEI